MTDSYKISSFDETSSTMVWKLIGKTFSMNLKDRELTDYRSVHPSHYLDTSNTQIVMIPTMCSRISFVDNNILFIKASQFEFDRWCYEIFPKSDNAKVYTILMNY
jgi:hypothetical protein